MSPRVPAAAPPRRLRVAYVYEFDAADPTVQSGRPHAILTQLRQHAELLPLFPLRQVARYLFTPLYALNRARGRIYRPDREPFYLRSLARQVEPELARLDPDVIVAPGAHMIAAIRHKAPKVFIADATFAGMVDSYDTFTNLAPRFLRHGLALDQHATDQAAAVIFGAEHAAQSAIQAYGAAPGKVRVIPWGANVQAPDRATVAAAIDRRGGPPLRLLFVGRDWGRKGGDIVLAACAELVGRGIELQLDLVGLAEPPVALPAYATSHGLLDQRRPEDAARLQTLFGQADLFFVPSRAEAFGMVFCEAAAFGLPVVSTRTGGIVSIVRDGVTGRLLPVEADGPAYAELIATELLDPAVRRRLAHAALAEYHERLNWDAFGRQLMATLHEVVGPGPAPRCADAA